jgi:hypothetical protein
MRWFAIMLALSLVIAACGGDDDDDVKSNNAESVGNFAVSVGSQMIAGEWEDVYAELHPDQQAVVTQDQFVACRSQLDSPDYEVTVGQVTQATDAASGVPDPNAWNAALTYQREGYETLAHTILVYHVDDANVWAMSQDSLSKFQAGGCDVEPLLASQFALSIANAEIAGDWATVYAGLHPNQQAIVPQDLFLECRAADTVQATAAETVGIAIETDAAVEVPETETYAVTLQLTFPDRDPENTTVHIYPVNDAFAWTLGINSMAAFSAGQCD